MLALETRRQPTLRTPRLLLRPFAAADAPTVHAVVSDREIAVSTLNIPHPYPDGLAEEWIAGQPKRWEAGEGAVFAAVLNDGGALVAAVGLDVSLPHRRGELGYWVAREFWNRGFATEAARAMVAFGFREMGLHRVQAQHFTRNPASGVVMQKLGMRHEGRLRHHLYKWGVHEDVEVYGLLEDELDHAGAYTI
jgi:[ribosomal protein S5]-alanine N-acetyltransferase